MCKNAEYISIIVADLNKSEWKVDTGFTTATLMEFASPIAYHGWKLAGVLRVPSSV